MKNKKIYTHDMKGEDLSLNKGSVIEVIDKALATIFEKGEKSFIFCGKGRMDNLRHLVNPAPIVRINGGSNESSLELALPHPLAHAFIPVISRLDIPNNIILIQTGDNMGVIYDIGDKSCSEDL